MLLEMAKDKMDERLSKKGTNVLINFILLSKSN